MPSLHPNFYPMYNVLIGCQITGYYTPSPEKELKITKLYLARTQGVNEGFNVTGKEIRTWQKKNRTWVLDETQENWHLLRGWSYDSLEEQYPKGVREPGLDQAVLGYRRAKARRVKTALWYEAILI